MLLSDVWRLSDVFRVHPVGGRRVWPAGWLAHIGWSGPTRPAWLKAAAARFRCRPGRGHIVAAAHLQLVVFNAAVRSRLCVLCCVYTSYLAGQFSDAETRLRLYTQRSVKWRLNTILCLNTIRHNYDWTYQN